MSENKTDGEDEGAELKYATLNLRRKKAKASNHSQILPLTAKINSINNSRINDLLSNLHIAIEDTNETMMNNALVSFNRSLSRTKSKRQNGPHEHKQRIEFKERPKKRIFKTLPDIKDRSASERILKSNLSLKQAEQEFNEEVKKRKMRKWEKWYMKNDGMQGKSYRELYQEIRKNQISEAMMDEECYELIAESNQFIKFYSELKDKPAIIDYIKKKIDSKRESCLEKEKKDSQKKVQIEQILLSFLRKRKHDTREEDYQIAEKWDEIIYRQELKNIEEVSRRMKKLFSKNSHQTLTPVANQKLKETPVWKCQEKILMKQNTSSGANISREGREELIKKFTAIISQLGKSLSKKKDVPIKRKSFQRPNCNISNSLGTKPISKPKHQKSRSISNSQKKNVQKQEKSVSRILPKCRNIQKDKTETKEENKNILRFFVEKLF